MKKLLLAVEYFYYFSFAFYFYGKACFGFTAKEKLPAVFPV